MLVSEYLTFGYIVNIKLTYVKSVYLAVKV